MEEDDEISHTAWTTVILGDSLQRSDLGQIHAWAKASVPCWG
jgi:hypothetical protein